MVEKHYSLGGFFSKSPRVSPPLHKLKYFLNSSVCHDPLNSERLIKI
uniref:Uncharacterized protein n=1 Tax=Vibrio tasmaniensis TaxID=212663 RepID=A0A0H3ZTI5_9VIBR|nr:hypothetical protein [Vibrio tasmaniensis]